ncbi:putative nuclease HARBI1 [Sesbania bispinosa]|nr:putative nuclease HARBI1 [Sesbania bispinosa]
MTVVEKVSIFVYTLSMGASRRDVGERFQHSTETIIRAFHEVLEVICDRRLEHFMKFWKSYVIGDEDTWVLHMTS